jgi:hypothetical protein
MTRFMQRSVISGCLAAASACAGDAPNERPEAVAAPETTVAGLEFGPPLTLGGPAPEASHLVFGAAAVAESEAGRFYVLNSGDGRVAAYDLTGRFLGEVGGAGEGPGRFSAPVGLAVGVDDAVYVLDAARFTLLEYGPDGDYRRNIGLDGTLGIPVAVAAGPDGRLLIEHRPMLGLADVEGVTIVALDPGTGASTPVVTLPAPGQRMVETVSSETRTVRSIEEPFGPAPFWAPASDGVLFGDGAEYLVRRAGAGGTSTVVRDTDWSARPVTDADRRAFLERQGLAGPDGAEIEFPAVKPYIGGMSAGPDGTVWLRVEWGVGGEEWRVHDRAGEALGMVRLPQRTRVAGLSPTAVYLVHYDADDAETLLRVPVRMP